MISKGFYEYLEIIADERRLDKEDVFKAVEIALIKAAQAEGHTGILEVEFNDEQKKVRITETFNVVEEIDPEGPDGQILLEEAREIKPKIKVGGQIKTEIHFNEISRKGAARFKNIFNQGLKEIGNKRAYEFFKEKVGEMVTGRILSVANGYAVLDIGKNTRVSLSISEALPSERLEPGHPLKVYITEVEETGRGPKIFVSRAHKNIIKRFIDMEFAHKLIILRESKRKIILITANESPGGIFARW